MRCERSVITTLLRLSCLVYSLGNCDMTLPTETGLTLQKNSLLELVRLKSLFVDSSSQAWTRRRIQCLESWT